MFKIRTMTDEDFQFAVSLTNTMDWNMADEDFEFILKLEPNGSFVLFDDYERVGIVTTISFGKIGWLGNLIVSQAHQNKGAGSRLAQRAVKYLKSRKAETVGLYAYLDKIPFYERLCFKYDSEFTVLRGTGFPSKMESILRPVKKEDIEEIISFDRTCFGASRKRLLKHLISNQKNSAYTCTKDGETSGYAVVKVYEDLAELGPLVCKPEQSDVAIDLLKAAMNTVKGLGVSLCVPVKQSTIIGMLMKAGFAENFRVARMFFNPQAVRDCIYMPESLERG